MQRCLGILVRKRRWSESSLIVTWLTDRFGALDTSARGALRPQSPFSGKLDLFHRAEVCFAFSRTSSLHSLREVELHAAFPSAAYPALAVASYFAELAAAVAPPMQPAHDLHDLLGRALAHLESHPPTRRALDHFEASTARILGVLDPGGRTPAHAALAHLCGRLPRSRTGALDAVA